MRWVANWFSRMARNFLSKDRNCVDEMFISLVIIEFLF
jgi:hypothetical protein